MRGALRRWRAGLGMSLAIHLGLLTISLPGAWLFVHSVERTMGSLRLDTDSLVELRHLGESRAWVGVLSFVLGFALTLLLGPALRWLWLAALDLDGGGFRGALRRARGPLLRGLVISYSFTWLQYLGFALAVVPFLLIDVPERGLPDYRALELRALALAATLALAAWALGGFRDAVLAALLRGHGVTTSLGRALRAGRLIPILAVFALLTLVLRGLATGAPWVLGGGALGIVVVQLALLGATLAHALWLALVRDVVR